VPSYLCVLERDVLTLFAPSGRVYAVPLPFHGKRVWPLERGIIVERYPKSLTRSRAHSCRLLIFINSISRAFSPYSHFDTAMGFVLWFLIHICAHLVSRHRHPPTRARSQTSKIERSAHVPAAHVAPTLFSLMHPLEELKPISYLPTPVVASASTAASTPASSSSAATPSSSSSSTLSSLPPSIAGAFFTDALECPLWASPSQPLLLTHHARTGRHTLYVVRQSRWERTKRRLATAATATATAATSVTSVTAATASKGASSSSIDHTPMATGGRMQRAADRASVLYIYIIFYVKTHI
jgi:hypothetical protein